LTLDEEIMESYVLNSPGHAGQARIGTLPGGRQRPEQPITYKTTASKNRK